MYNYLSCSCRHIAHLYSTHPYFVSISTISYRYHFIIVKLHNHYFAQMSYLGRCITLMSISTISCRYRFAYIKGENRKNQEQNRCRYRHNVYDIVDIDILNVMQPFFRFDMVIVFTKSSISI